MTGRAQLRGWLTRSKLNQVQGANALGITETYMSLLLSGHRRPGRDNAIKLERLTGIPVAAWSSTELDQITAVKPKRTRKHAA